MTTAEMVLENPAAVMRAATPLASGIIQGSTSSFDRTAKSPVFFASPAAPGTTVAFWETFVDHAVRFYTMVTMAPTDRSRILMCSPSISSLSWDRLSIELMRIANLPPNWDGESADAPSKLAVKTAGDLLIIAQTVVELATTAECPLPALFPTVDGGVLLKWTYGDKELKCTVVGDGVEVIRWKSVQAYESDGLWELPVRRVAEHFEWLLTQ